MDSTSIYKNANSNTLIGLFFLSAGIIGVCLYLTHYYFQTIYPVNLENTSICDINNFFNCNTTTHSPVSNIFGVPISLLGLCVGILSMAGFCFNSQKYERTLYTILSINAIGCLFLLIYSLIVLKTLCPLCTLYYVLSFLLLIIFHKKLASKAADVKIFFLMSLVFVSTMIPSYIYVQSKESYNDKMKGPLMEQFHQLPTLGHPEKESPYKISFPVSGEAPLKIVKFSDFECPSCKALSLALNQVAQRYKGQVDIQYFFYPLSSLCNPDVETLYHQNACYASYLAYCLPQKFRDIEHLIFANQSNLSREWVESIAKQEGVLDCFESDETKAAVIEFTQLAKPFNVSSTPTILINGKKISGALPCQSNFYDSRWTPP